MRGFLWLQCLMRLTLFLRFNSSAGTERKPQAVQGRVREQQGERTGWRALEHPRSLGAPNPGNALPVTPLGELGTGTSTEGDSAGENNSIPSALFIPRLWDREENVLSPGQHPGLSSASSDLSPSAETVRTRSG